MKKTKTPKNNKFNVAEVASFVFTKIFGERIYFVKYPDNNRRDREDDD